MYPMTINVTPLFKIYSTFRLHQLKQQSVSTIQQRQLFRLLHTAQSTLFGKHYDFKNIRTVEEYQRIVPLRTYDNFWQGFWGNDFPELVNCTWPGKIRFFAMPSGTTSGRPRYIPVSQEMVVSNKKASFDLFSYHLANNPQSKLFAGKGVLFAGLSDVTPLADDVYAGLITAILVRKTMPWWVRPWYLTLPEPQTGSMSMTDKIHHLARTSLQHDMRSLSGFPTALLTFFHTLREYKSCGDAFRLVDYFPHLDMLVHGGVSFTPYHTQFSKFLEGSHCELRELYATSEGFVASADRQPGEGLRLNCDHGIFYEFVRVEDLRQDNPTRYWIDTVETGVDYAIVLSTCAGLWSYVLGDIIRFVELAPPRILIQGRISQTLSINGEKLFTEDICHAVTYSAEMLGLIISEFTAGISLPQLPGERGQHIYVIECHDVPKHLVDIRRFADTIHQSLCRHSRTYECCHMEKHGFDVPDVLIVAPGTFQEWMQLRGEPDGKVPRIIADPEQFNTFLAFARSCKA